MMEGNSNPALPVATASYHWARDDANCNKKGGDDTDMEWKGFGALYAPLRSELPGFWSGFHVFSAQWHSDRIDFYLDGDSKPTYSKEASKGVFIANTSQKIIFDMDVQPADDDFQDNYDENTRLEVEWVRVYRKCSMDMIV